MAFRNINLAGPEGNAFWLIGTATTWAKQLNEVTGEYDFQKITKEMMEGDYNHLLDTFDKYFKYIVDYEFINDPRYTGGDNGF